MSKSQSQAGDVDDINNPKVAASTLDFLLLELVPLAQRIAERIETHEQLLQDEYQRSRTLHSTAANDVEDLTTTDTPDTAKTIDNDKRPLTSIGIPATTPSIQDAMHARLDSQGYRVGQGLVERFSTNTPRPTTPLDVIKFLCKDLWPVLFRKQIDNLKTNHRGIFVLTDSRFLPLSRMSVDRRAGPKAREEGIARAQLYLYFPAGVIRGALSGLGIEAVVTPECAELPTATFQIKTKGAKT